MTRFCKQRDRYSCGPVALLNIDKHFGRQATYKDLPRYRKRVRCKRPDGTNPSGTYLHQMRKVLGRPSRRKFEKAKEFLRSGGCIVVMVNEHYFIITMDHIGIATVNCWRSGPCVCHVYPKVLKKKLDTAYRTWYVKQRTGIL